VVEMLLGSIYGLVWNLWHSWI